MDETGIKVEPPTPNKAPNEQPTKTEEQKEGMLSPSNQGHNAFASKEMPIGYKCQSGWFELKAKGKLPKKRSYQSSVIFDGKLYIYGGEDIKEGKFEDLQYLDLDEFFDHEEKDLEDKEVDDEEHYRWKTVTTTGDKPGPLAHHKACIHNQCMYLIGGLDGVGNNNPNFYSLDMNTFKWTKIEADEAPEPRDDHSICVDEDKLFVFGGFVSGVRRNDLYAFDFTAETWECLYEHKELDYDEAQNSTDTPEPRSGQAIGASGGRVYVFGGRNNFNDMLGDTWEFDSASKSWSRIECDNQPIGRSSHTLTVEGTRMILFGGIVDITKEINELHQFDFGKKSWEQIDDDVAHKDGIERSPSPRKPRRDFNRDPAADTTIRSKPGKSPNKKKTNDPMRDRNYN